MKNQAEVFDKIADNYRKIHTKNVGAISGVDSDYFSKYKFEEISRRVKNTSKELKILDFGCGDGIGATYANMFFPNSKYYGIDVSEKSITVAKQKHAQNHSASFKIYDGSSIPFEDNAFDIVFVSCVFHHIDADKHCDCLKELNRVMMGGGIYSCLSTTRGIL